VKAGSWWPETVTKGLRAQEIAMRNRVPIVYLVDSAGVNLPYQDRISPGQYGGGRIFYYNCLMRRKLRVPQIAAVMGPCIAGGAYLPALSDSIIMVEGTSFMGLGGPNLVKGATGQAADSESIGGARLHTTVSGVAHYLAKDDADCLARIRQRFRDLLPPPEMLDSAGLMERASQIAAAAAAASPTAIRGGLVFVREARERGWQETGVLARQMRAEIFRSADFEEGIRAFREKRPPRWPSLAIQHLGGISG